MVTNIQQRRLTRVNVESASDTRTQSQAVSGDELTTSLRSFRGRLLKRLIDISLSLPVVIFVLPPVAAITWVTHRLQSPGALFFKQERCGIDRAKFTILKFRTMDQAPDSLAGNVEARIFPLGSLLRKTKLDEVPQFVNVLGGSMSIVGPRPHHFEDCENFEEAFKDYAIRTIAKPGITGLAQYKEYRGDFEWNCVENRVKRDLVYIREWSILLDLKLILKTANVIFTKSRRALATRVGHRLKSAPATLSIFDQSESDADREAAAEVVAEISDRKAA